MKGTILLVAGLSLALAGCGPKPGRTEAPTLPTATVRALTIESKTRVATEEVVGTVRAKFGRATIKPSPCANRPRRI